MRHVFPPLALFLFASVAPAADPKPEESSRKYLDSLQKTAELLAKVKDETTAAELKPKIENLYEEGREARQMMFKAMAEVDIPDSTLAHFFEHFPKVVKPTSDSITAEFDRIGTKQKAAYKVLRETKLFAGLEKEFEERAVGKAKTLIISAKSYSTRNDGKAPKLEDLAKYAEEGQKALTDPWGSPYQLVLKAEKDGIARTYVWTVSPYTGKKLGSPPPEEK